MSRTTIKRLARLESLRPVEQRIPRCHVIHGETHEEADANHAALIASGEAEEGDRFIHLVFVSPAPEPEATT
jgi:hypothetical protein